MTYDSLQAEALSVGMCGTTYPDTLLTNQGSWATPTVQRVKLESCALLGTAQWGDRAVERRLVIRDK